MKIDEAIELVEHAMQTSEPAPIDFDMLLPAACRLVLAISEQQHQIVELQQRVTSLNRMIVTGKKLDTPDDVTAAILTAVKRGKVSRSLAARMLSVGDKMLHKMLRHHVCD